MNEESIIKRFEINIQQIANDILFGSSIMKENNSFEEREKIGREELWKSMQRCRCSREEFRKAFEEYAEAIKEIYFEIGVNVGICIQLELLLKPEGI